MKSDLYLKTILTIIAICLTVTTVKALPLIADAKAAGYAHCTGKLTANMNGGTTATLGGYEIDVTCN